MLLRHVWPLRGTGQYVALGMVAAAAVVWSIALLAFTTSRARRDEEALLGRRVFSTMTAGTLMLAGVGLVLAFVAPP